MNNNAYSMLISTATPDQIKVIEARRLELLNIAFNLQKKHKASAKKENK